jgi:hypothetical protein
LAAWLGLFAPDCYGFFIVAPFGHPTETISAPLGSAYEHKEKTMSYKVMLIGLMLAASAGELAFAAPVHYGQYPASPARASESALPDCGFAATESWGPNGFQYCDARNVYGRRSWR